MQVRKARWRRRCAEGPEIRKLRKKKDGGKERWMEDEKGDD